MEILKNPPSPPWKPSQKNSITIKSITKPTNIKLNLNDNCQLKKQ